MLNIKTTATRGKLESLLQKINLPNLFSYYIKSTSSANVDHENPNDSRNIHVLKLFHQKMFDINFESIFTYRILLQLKVSPKEIG